MGRITVKTTNIKTCEDSLKEVKKYFTGKKAIFNNGNYGSSACSALSNFLGKINKNLTQIE
ncbi:MAG: hypothetical protein K2M17_00455, partial [Bacilli bacterium]|nr:hypothetical protein [Bacilli bacterium]